MAWNFISYPYPTPTEVMSAEWSKALSYWATLVGTPLCWRSFICCVFHDATDVRQFLLQKSGQSQGDRHLGKFFAVDGTQVGLCLRSRVNPRAQKRCLIPWFMAQAALCGTMWYCGSEVQGQSKTLDQSGKGLSIFRCDRRRGTLLQSS